MDLKRKLSRLRSDVDAALAAAQRTTSETIKSATAVLQPKEAAKQLEERLGGVEAAVQRGLRSVSEKAAAALQLKADDSAVADLKRNLEAAVEQAASRAAAAEAAAASAAEAAAEAETVAERIASHRFVSGGFAGWNSGRSVARQKGESLSPTGFGSAAAGFCALDNADFEGALSAARLGSPRAGAAAVGSDHHQQHAAGTRDTATAAAAPPTPQLQHQQLVPPSTAPALNSCEPLSLGRAAARGSTSDERHREQQSTAGGSSAGVRVRGGAAYNAKRARDEAQRRQQQRVLSAPLPQRCPEGGLDEIVLVGSGTKLQDIAKTVPGAAAAGGQQPADAPASAQSATATATAAHGSETDAEAQQLGTSAVQAEPSGGKASAAASATASAPTGIGVPTGNPLRMLSRGPVGRSANDRYAAAAAALPIPVGRRMGGAAAQQQP